LLGVARDRLTETARWTGDFVRCLSPLSTPEQIEQSKTAAGHLLDLFRSLLTGQRTGGLLGTLAAVARRLGREDVDVIVAEGVRSGAGRAAATSPSAPARTSARVRPLPRESWRQACVSSWRPDFESRISRGRRDTGCRATRVSRSGR